jgi:hypothetical protein
VQPGFLSCCFFPEAVNMNSKYLQPQQNFCLHRKRKFCSNQLLVGHTHTYSLRYKSELTSRLIIITRESVEMPATHNTHLKRSYLAEGLMCGISCGKSCRFREGVPATFATAEWSQSQIASLGAIVYELSDDLA